MPLLQAELQPAGYEFVNAGKSGDLAWNLRQRLNDIIACGPDAGTVWIGTNDTAARISDTWRDGYLKQQRLPRQPDLE